MTDHSVCTMRVYRGIRFRVASKKKLSEPKQFYSTQEKHFLHCTNMIIYVYFADARR